MSINPTTIETEILTDSSVNSETNKKTKFNEWDKIKPFTVIKLYNAVSSNKDSICKLYDVQSNEAIIKKLKSIIEQLMNAGEGNIEGYLQDNHAGILTDIIIDVLGYSRGIVETLTGSELDDITYVSFLRNKIFLDESINWNSMKVLPEDQINYMVEEIAKKMKLVESKKSEINTKKTIAKYVDGGERIVTTQELLNSISGIISQFVPPVSGVSQNNSKDWKTLIVGLNQLMFGDEKKTQSFEWTREKCLLKLESVITNIIKYQLNGGSSYDSLRIMIGGHTIEDKLAKDNQSYKTKRYFLRSIEMVLILRSLYHALKPYFGKVSMIVMNNDTERSQKVSEFVTSNNYLPSSNYLIGKYLKQVLEQVDGIQGSVYHGNYDTRALDYILETGLLQRVTTSKYMKTTDIYGQASINAETINGKTSTLKMASVIKFLESYSAEPYFYHSNGYTKVTINSFSWVYGETEFILSPQQIQNRRMKPSNDFIFLTEENGMIMSHELIPLEIGNSLKVFNKLINISALENKISQISNPINTSMRDLL